MSISKTNVNNPIIIKYEPKLLNDMYLDINIYNILDFFIKNLNNNILLKGNILTGKTTILNCIKNEWIQQNKIDENLFIDGLNDPGISYFRTTLKNFCQTTNLNTNTSNKKIIIIDNLEYISKQGQYLLSTYINKYEKNFKVIASCSLQDKIMLHIQSFFNIVKLPNITEKKLINICNFICKQENIYIDNKYIHLFLDICDGSICKILNYLEIFKLLNYNVIDKTIIDNTNYNITIKLLNELFVYFKEKEYKKSIEIINTFIDNGYSVLDILNKIVDYVKHSNKFDTQLIYKIIPLICKYTSLFHKGYESKIELYFFINELINIL